MKRKNKIIIILVALLTLLFSLLMVYNIFYTSNNTNKKYKVKLNKCIDGDTAWFIINDKKKKYRFLAVDSPELNKDYGEIASKYTCKLLTEAKKIEIEYDKVGQKTDKYNRELVWIYIDGKLLQEELLNEGYAKIKYIYANYDYLNKLYEIEKNAIDRKVGIWNNYNYEVYNSYFTVVFQYSYYNETYKVIKNNKVELINNPYKEGCRFIGWKNGNYLFDLSTKINKNYKLKPSFDC